MLHVRTAASLAGVSLFLAGLVHKCALTQHCISVQQSVLTLLVNAFLHAVLAAPCVTSTSLLQVWSTYKCALTQQQSTAPLCSKVF